MITKIKTQLKLFVFTILLACIFDWKFNLISDNLKLIFIIEHFNLFVDYALIDN